MLLDFSADFDIFVGLIEKDGFFEKVGYGEWLTWLLIAPNCTGLLFLRYLTPHRIDWFASVFIHLLHSFSLSLYCSLTPYLLWILAGLSAGKSYSNWNVLMPSWLGVACMTTAPTRYRDCWLERCPSIRHDPYVIIPCHQGAYQHPPCHNIAYYRYGTGPSPPSWAPQIKCKACTIHYPNQSL